MSIAFTAIVVLIAMIFIVFVYFYPTYVAWSRCHKNLKSLSLLNIFFGWTLIGWVLALIWAYLTEQQAQKV